MSLAAVILDTSFFSFLPVNDASVIISFLIVILFALKLSEDFLIAGFFAIIFLTILSSLPPWLILICYLLLPSIIFYLRGRYLPEPSYVAAIVYFVVLNFIFDLVLLLNVGGFSARGMTSLLYFVLINSFVGMILFTAVDRIHRSFKKGEIKGI